MLYGSPRARLIVIAISITAILLLLFYFQVLGFSGNGRFMATLESQAWLAFLDHFRLVN